MQKLRLLFIFLILTVGSCSSDDPEDIIIVGPAVEPPTAAPSVLNMKINGEDYAVNIAARTLKSEETVHILLYNNGGEISFDTSGRFGFCKLVILDGFPSFEKTFYSKPDYSSNYFTFHLDSYDEVNKRVKGYFSGYVYRTSQSLVESKFVNGTFDLSYDVLIPPVSNLGNSAKINGADWAQTNSYSTRGTGAAYGDITRHTVSDDQYKIMIHYQEAASPVGTYNFTNTDATNKVQLAKFDPISGTYTDYICTGTLVFNRREQRIFGGTYQFTAVNPTNPSDIIQVTNGTFKFIFIYFP